MKKITKTSRAIPEEDEVSSSRICQKFHCVADELTEDISTIESCGSSDALAIYENENSEGEIFYSSYCYSCNQSFQHDLLAKSSLASELGLEDNGKVKKDFTIAKISKAEPLTREEVQALIKGVGYKGKNYRGLKDEFVKYYGCLTKLSSKGDVLARYYPETIKSKVSGYTIRKHPKNFNQPRLGRTGIGSDLYGQVRWRKGGGKYCLIVGGQEDCHAALQMFVESSRAKGNSDYDPFPIVSPTTGEGSAYKQLASQYDWLNTFDYIYVALDDDKAGQKAMEKCIEVLPAEKVHIVKWSDKDPNNMLQKGKAKQFIRDFYNAKPYLKDSVKTSKDADDEMEEEIGREKIPMPTFLKPLQDIMAGGIPLGYIVNIGAETGGGKTTIVNEMIYSWIFDCPYRVGILTLELNAGQYQTAMLSRHIGQKIQLIEDPKEALDFVRQDWVVEKRKELKEFDDGQARYHLLDGRDGTLKDIQNHIDKLIKKYDCKFIVIDPINDLFEGVSLEEQTAFVKYLKGVISKGITIVNICHITKGTTIRDKDGDIVVRKLTEADFAGVSNIVKSGGCNITATRDKLSEDPIVKNTTFIEVLKCRWTGRSGAAGKIFYESEAHTLHDYDTFFEGQDPIENASGGKKITKPSKPKKIEGKNDE